MRAIKVLLLAFCVIIVTSSPASGQFFLCEKTGVNSEPIDPSNPQYDKLEYDLPFVSLFKNFLRLALTGVFVMGIVGSIYATIRDSMYTAEGDGDKAKYVRMRVRSIIFGIGIPAVVLIISYIIESITYYETTCFVPSVL